MHRDGKAAFTLIELLVVIAIIAVLAAILFPVFARAREKARQATCLSNQKQIAAAVMMYVQDYDETFPFVLDQSANCMFDTTNMGDNGKHPLVPGVTGQEPPFQLVTVVAPYVKNPGVWYCPSVGPDAVWDAEAKGGYWKKGATMRTQGTTYGYIWMAWPFPYTVRWPTIITFMGGKSYAILREPSRWPMLCDEPDGWQFGGNITDPPPSVVPHFGGLNVAYGDGHARYHHLAAADGSHYLFAHVGDGLSPGQ
jgi:prepilin-type N-terminal cleavage/methylation domain-containing protein/prepilin-type processing-associated H-X9-DG protein